MPSSLRDRVTLTGKRMKAIRIRLGMSRDEFACELGLCGTVKNNFKAIDRIESGERNASLPMAKLAFMLERYGAQDWPEDLLATPLQD